jgi:hypothetical protein
MAPRRTAPIRLVALIPREPDECGLPVLIFDVTGAIRHSRLLRRPLWSALLDGKPVAGPTVGTGPATGARRPVTPMLLLLILVPDTLGVLAWGLVCRSSSGLRDPR